MVWKVTVLHEVEFSFFLNWIWFTINCLNKILILKGKRWVKKLRLEKVIVYVFHLKKQ